MPDVYNDSVAPASQSQGSTTINQSGFNVPAPMQTPTYEGAGAGKKPTIDPYDQAFKSALGDAYSATVNSDWAKSETVTQPTIKTPVNSAMRYLKNWNSDIGFDVTDPKLEQKYGEEQGFWVRGLNRFLKTGATAAVSFATTLESTLINPLLGIDNVSSADISMADNWLSKLDTEELPNFQTQYQKDNPNLSFFNPLHFTSWMDNVGQVTQNLGFTIGALAAAAVVDVPLALVGTALGEAPLVAEGGMLARQAGKIYSGIGKLSRLLNSGTEEYQGYKNLVNSGENVLKALDKSSKIINGFNGARFLAGVGLSAYGESIMEANNGYLETKKDLQSRYVDEYGNYNGTEETTQEIERTAKDVGKSIVAPNFAFLAVSNMIGLGSILRPANAAIKATEEALAKEVAMKVNPLNINTFEIVNTGKKGLAGMFSKASGVGTLIGTNLREAAEEGYQYVVSESSKDYYKRRFDTHASNETYTMADSIGKGINNLFTTTEGQQNMLMGFLGGAFQHVGQHGINRVRGINPLSGAALAANIQGRLEKDSVTGLFNVARNEAVTATSINKEMQQALRKGDIFEYKNLQHQQLFNFVASGVEANKFDLRVEQLEALKNLSKEDFQTMFNLELNETSHATVSDYVDSVIEKAHSIKEDIDKINISFGSNPFSANKDKDNYDMFNAYKGELAITVSQQRDQLNRVRKINEAIFSQIPTASIKNVAALSDVQGVNETIKRFNKKIADLKNSETLATGNEDLREGYKKEREFLEGSVIDLQGHLKEFDPDMYIKTVTSLYNYFGNAESLNGDTNINELDTLGVYNNSLDLHRLADNTDRIRRYYRDMTSKQGFKNFEEDFGRRVDGFIDRVRIDDKGRMKVLTDEEIDAELSAKDDTTASDDSKDFVHNTLDVASQTEGEEKIDNEDKELIAKLLDDGEVAPEGEKSTADKIRSGETPITQEMKDAAKAALKAEFDNITEEPVADENQPAPVSTKAVERERKTREEAKKKGINLPDDATDEDTNINEIMGGTTSTQPAPVETPAEPTEITTNPIIRFWNKFKFSVAKELNRVLTFDNPKDDVKYKTNLDRIVLGNMKPELLHKNVISKLRLEVTKSTKGKSDTERSLMRYFPPGNSKGLLFDNLYRAGFAVDANVMIGDTQVGILHPPTSIQFKRGSEFFTLDKLKDAQEYADVTLNHPSTFDQFKKEFAEYKAAYDEITDGYKAGEMLHVANDKLLKVFTPVVSYGSVRYTKKSQDSTLIKDLKYRGKGDAILSFPMEYNEQTEHYERTKQPVILNESDLSAEQIAETLEHVGANIDKIHSQDVRYIYLMRMPDGNFGNQSVIVARPDDESPANLDGFVRQLQDALLNPASESVFDINRQLGEAVYVATNARKNDTKTRRTSARFSVRRYDKKSNNTIVLNIYNEGEKIKKRIEFSQEEINNLNGIDSLISLANQKMTEEKKTDRRFRNLAFDLKKEDFKKHLPSDENISKEDLENNLKVSVTPKVFENTSLTFMPANGNPYVAPSETTSKKPKKSTSPKTAGEIKTAGEGKVSTPAKVSEPVAVPDVNMQALQQERESLAAQIKDLRARMNALTSQIAADPKLHKDIKEANEKTGLNKVKADLNAAIDREKVVRKTIEDTVPKAIAAIHVGQTYLNKEGNPVSVSKIEDKDGKTFIKYYDSDTKTSGLANATDFLNEHTLKPSDEKVTSSAPVEATPNKGIDYGADIVNKNLNNIITQLKAQGLLKTDC